MNDFYTVFHGDPNFQNSEFACQRISQRMKRSMNHTNYYNVMRCNKLTEYHTDARLITLRYKKVRLNMNAQNLLKTSNYAAGYAFAMCFR